MSEYYSNLLQDESERRKTIILFFLNLFSIAVTFEN